MIAKILQRVFPDKHVKGVRDALRELRPLFEEAPAPSFAIDEISKRVASGYLKSREELEKAVSEGTTYRVACLKAMLTLTQRDLMGGTESAGPGRLTMVGDGKRSIFHIAFKELQKSGVCTEEMRLRRIRELDEDIRQIW